MGPGRFRFDRFVLDPRDRQLRRDDAPVEINARYLDALGLLVSDAGKLVSKDRFLDEVWRGVPVTDEALTQCIKTLRRQLGDDAGNPRFIETVPKHGYRFIAPVERVEDDEGNAPGNPSAAPASGWRGVSILATAGTVGGAIAGLAGGIFYGFLGASQPLEPGMGAASVLLVLAALCVFVAAIGAAGVAIGIAAAAFGSGWKWDWRLILGGAAGGLIVGAIVKLVGTDAFNLLFGRAPGGITGAGEGALLGAAVGLGAWLGTRGQGPLSLRQGATAAGLSGAVAGAAIPLFGGRMMAGSLDSLARGFPESRLSIDHLGGLFGETGFGPTAHIVTGALEGMLFSSCVVVAMIVARRTLGK
jgi:DNA-binding winged helix-turn-helix (wHTH) protein